MGDGLLSYEFIKRISDSIGIWLRGPEITSFDLMPIRLVLVYLPLAHVAPCLLLMTRICRRQLLHFGGWVTAAGLHPTLASVHTPTMTLKNAALLALIGTILATVFLVWTFVMTVLNVLRGFAPPLMLVPGFIYAFVCLSAAVFFYVFHKAHS
jgi:hypothetical protein